MKHVWILVHDWIKKQWHRFRPGAAAWQGAAWGMVIGGCLFWVITQLVMIVPGMLIWVILLNIFIPPILILLAAGLVHGLLAWLAVWPKLFRWALLAALVLFSAPFALMVRFDRAAAAGTALFVVAASLLGAGAAVLLKEGWQPLRRFQRVFLMIGLVLGLGSLTFGLVWMLTPGGAGSEVVNAALVHIEQVQPLDLPDPSQPGSYEVAALTYGTGTDLRRPEYGSGVDLVSRSVNAAPFVQGWEGFAGWALRQYWGFDLKSLPLNGRVWYPRGEGPYPLVLVVHGNHRQEDFSDPGYAFLGEHLASRGMIVVSVDQNFLNGTWTGLFNGKETKNENDARAWLLLEHLRLWKEWNQDDENPFYQTIDWHNLALIGHSRGGEAVAEAALFNSLPAYPDNARIKFNYQYPIRAVIAIAPTDSQYNPGGWDTPLADTNYLVLHGSMDGDVTSFDGIGQYNRLHFNPNSENFKAAVYIHGANHGQFNSGWGKSDSGPGLGAAFWNTTAIMPAAEQERAAKVFISSFLAAAFDDRRGYLEIFRDWRVAADWLPAVVYLTQYDDAGYLPVADFEEDLDTSSATLENAEIFAEGLTQWKEGLLMGKWNQSLSTSVVTIGWQPSDDRSSSALYGINLDPHSVSLTPQDYFVFSMGDSVGENGEKEAVPVEAAQGINFSVELASGDQKAVVPMDEVMLLQPQIQVQLAKAGFLDQGEQGETVLQRFYIPLRLFLEHNAAFESDAVDSIRFRFDQTPAGEVVLDEIGFWQPYLLRNFMQK